MSDLEMKFVPSKHGGGLWKIYKGMTFKEMLDEFSQHRDYYISDSDIELAKSITNKEGMGYLSYEEIKDEQIYLKNLEGGKIKLTPEQAMYFITIK